MSSCVWNPGSLRTMHGGGSAPSCCAFTHRVAFEEGSGPRVLLKSGLRNRGRSACGTTHVARLEFPRETGLILRGAGKAGNPFQTSQGNRISVAIRRGEGAQMKMCRDPRCCPRGNPACRGTFGGHRKAVRDCFALQGGTGTCLETPSRARASACQEVGTTWFFSSCGGILELQGDLSLPLGLALGSPIFPSGCEGKLGVALESLQGRRDLT